MTLIFWNGFLLTIFHILQISSKEKECVEQREANWCTLTSVGTEVSRYETALTFYGFPNAIKMLFQTLSPLVKCLGAHSVALLCSYFLLKCQMMSFGEMMFHNDYDSAREAHRWGRKGTAVFAAPYRKHVSQERQNVLQRVQPAAQDGYERGPTQSCKLT